MLVCALQTTIAASLFAQGILQQPQLPDPEAIGRFRLGFIRFTPSITLTNLGVDTNVFNELDDPKDDFTVTFGPKAEFWSRLGPRGHLYGNVGRRLPVLPGVRQPARVWDRQHGRGLTTIWDASRRLPKAPTPTLASVPDTRSTTGPVGKTCPGAWA